MRTGTTWIFLTLIQANQSDGISPELEEKIHEMQVEMQKQIIRVFILKFEIPDWQVVRESIVTQLRSTGVRKVHVNGAREHKLPAAGIFSKIHEKENTDGVARCCRCTSPVRATRRSPTPVLTALCASMQTKSPKSNRKNEMLSQCEYQMSCNIQLVSKNQSKAKDEILVGLSSN